MADARVVTVGEGDGDDLLVAEEFGVDNTGIAGLGRD
jgi:hypothetical protein